ncbi:MAG: hypothetical protein NUK54_01875, partial [Methanothrix sp.]|nr:hypothetical protein [Methanothrix sp.]
VEISTGMNVFQAHILSFDGSLPDRPKPRGFGGRGVIFAKSDIKIGADLRTVTASIADVPRPGTIAKRGDPLSSILSFGEDWKGAMDLLKRRSWAVYRAFRL